jgi:hypothetical protein
MPTSKSSAEAARRKSKGLSRNIAKIGKREGVAEKGIFIYSVPITRRQPFQLDLQICIDFLKEKTRRRGDWDKLLLKGSGWRSPICRLS